MPILIDTRFAFSVEAPTDVLLQFEAAEFGDQRVEQSDTDLTNSENMTRVPAEDDIGERLWVRADGEFAVCYRAAVSIARQSPDLAILKAVAPHNLPSEAVHYLLDSRYCPADRFQSFVETEFKGYEGGIRIQAISDWIAQNFTYAPGASTAETDAAESLTTRRGVCRDYAHALIALARASAIPARYVSCYAPGVTPPDFHAVAEVFLADPATARSGAWHLVDPTGMAKPQETVIIGVGRDAADVSFLTSFGPSLFLSSSVCVTKE